MGGANYNADALIDVSPLFISWRIILEVKRGERPRVTPGQRDWQQLGKLNLGQGLLSLLWGLKPTPYSPNGQICKSLSFSFGTGPETSQAAWGLKLHSKLSAPLTPTPTPAAFLSHPTHLTSTLDSCCSLCLECPPHTPLQTLKQL